MDQIRINNLKVFAHHGVYDEEQQQGQNFYVDAVLFLPLQRSGLEDDLDQSVNYADLASFISGFMKEHTYQLIEAAAEQLSIAVLNRFRKVREIELEVRKPEAPMDAEVDSASVRIRRRRHQAYIGIGSNMGNSLELVQDGTKAVDADLCCRVIKESGMIRSTPYGGVVQDDFVNRVILIETYYEPLELLDFLHKVENDFGRRRMEHWGPRTLDLDILFYDDLVLDLEDLTIPHPDMQNRDFVMVPLYEIAPFLRHPLTHKTITDMVKEQRESHILEENP